MGWVRARLPSQNPQRKNKKKDQKQMDINPLPNLTKPSFVIAVALIAIVAVFAYNTWLVPTIAEKTGKDLTA